MFCQCIGSNLVPWIVSSQTRRGLRTASIRDFETYEINYYNEI